MFRQKRKYAGSYGGSRRGGRAGKIGKILLGILIVLLILGGLAAWYLLTPYGPTGEAEQALTAQQQGVTVHTTENWIEFDAAKSTGNSLIFYPGARVKPESYSLFARDLAAAGHSVYIMKFPFNFAFTKANAADAVISSHPDEKFIIGGHSLGGVFASRYAVAHTDRIAGVFFLASYPDQNGNLAELGLPVMSITGSEDGVLQKDKYEASRSLLPADTAYYSVQGGNHGQFGSYGEQKGDQPAKVSAEEQRAQTVNALLSWMKEIPAAGEK
ncbi:alpha/beta fold hydrolase [Paenibacillus wulumuqiensis]|uniref:alpha/beta fold hydrolase n=1 Tax=Paenibacillus wulumuqiensis TaxID=1567107 RepID=UPI0006195CC7|nr:alpha/beta fold hydrolase [Paenibacillus wulumuqiensis]